MKKAMALAGTMALAACVSAPAAQPQRVAIAPPRYPAAGLEGIVGQSDAALVRLFGAPDRDIREGAGRKLQFAGPFCVLDAYLYPKARGGEPVVSYLDARQPDGRDIDRASCVAAMQRRAGGR